MTARHLEIVGAGPAGLAAALTARAAGASVTLYEKHAHAGGRFHGDFQGLENWTTDEDVLSELVRLGVPLGFEPTPVREVVCFDGRGNSYRLNSGDRPAFYLVKRGAAEDSLDTALVRQVLKTGANVRWSTRVEHLRANGIAAEGPHEADVIAVGYTFTTDMAEGCYVALSESLAPAGYAYLLVHAGAGTAATCLYRDFHNDKQYLARTIDFFKQAAGLRWSAARAFGGSGNVLRRPILRSGSLLHAGECAGLQDPLFGFGLRYALLSGHFAARAWLAGAAEVYEHLWHARIRNFVRAGMFNRWLYESLGDSSRRFLTKYLAPGADPRRILARFYRPSRTKVLLSSLIPQARGRYVVKPDCGCTWCRCRKGECEWNC